jgi:hypothetical protein
VLSSTTLKSIISRVLSAADLVAPSEIELPPKSPIALLRFGSTEACERAHAWVNNQWVPTFGRILCSLYANEDASADDIYI